MRFINPVIVEPLAAEWEAAKRIIAERMALYEKGGKARRMRCKKGRAHSSPIFKVLDPACGSGNFLW